MNDIYLCKSVDTGTEFGYKVAKFRFTENNMATGRPLMRIRTYCSSEEEYNNEKPFDLVRDYRNDTFLWSLSEEVIEKLKRIAGSLGYYEERITPSGDYDLDNAREIWNALVEDGWTRQDECPF